LEQAVAVVAGKGYLWKEELATLAKEFQGRFSEADIRRQVRVPVREKDAPRAKPVLDPSHAKRIQDRLQLLGKKDLYDFLERPASSSRTVLRDRAQEVYRAALDNNNKTAEVTARQELAGDVLELFKTEAGQEKYNNTLARQRLAELDGLIQAAAASGRIEVGVTRELLRVARDKGLDEDETLDYLRAKAAEKRASLEIPSLQDDARPAEVERARKKETPPVPPPPVPPALTQYRRLAVVLATGAAAAVLVGYGFHHAAFTMADRPPAPPVPESSVPGQPAPVSGLETGRATGGPAPEKPPLFPPEQAGAENEGAKLGYVDRGNLGGQEQPTGGGSSARENGTREPVKPPPPPPPPWQSAFPSLTGTAWEGEYKGNDGKDTAFAVGVIWERDGQIRGKFEWQDLGLLAAFRGAVTEDRRLIQFHDLKEMGSTHQLPSMEFSAAFDGASMLGQADGDPRHTFKVRLLPRAEKPPPSRPPEPPTKPVRAPSQRGTVLAVLGDIITVALGQKDGIRVNDLLTVTVGYSTRERIEVEAWVESVESDTCTARLSRIRAGQPGKGDRVERSGKGRRP